MFSPMPWRLQQLPTIGERIYVRPSLGLRGSSLTLSIQQKQATPETPTVVHLFRWTESKSCIQGRAPPVSILHLKIIHQSHDTLQHVL
jgi:hypothetical protein